MAQGRRVFADFKIQLYVYGPCMYFMSVTVTNTTLFMVFYFADFVLRPRIVPDFAVYVIFYLKKYFTLRFLKLIC